LGFGQSRLDLVDLGLCEFSHVGIVTGHELTRILEILECL